MCLCPLPNYRIESESYKHGLRYFDCGACPECLSKRASQLVLRAVYEAKQHKHNCMCCLTYDQYIRDESGKIVGEQVADRSVDKKDVQKFIKRVRDYFGYPDMKYLLSAEYGKHTGRPHYHVLFFGIHFSDAVYYKKSKRGHIIMQSHTLNKLWKHGICTVDSNSINAAKARYCTKYAVKDSRTKDTFSLISQKLGLNGLLRDFNGRYYILEGRQYAVPRVVWQEYISRKYSHLSREFTTKYINAPSVFDSETGEFLGKSPRTSALLMRNDERRAFYRSLRDSDKVYRDYLAYWQRKSLIFDKSFNTISKRILLLDDRKYHNYKIAALEVYANRIREKPFVPPGSNCKSQFFKWFDDRKIFDRCTCPIPSRHNRASDRKKRKIESDDQIQLRLFGIDSFKPSEKEQISFENFMNTS